MTRTSVLALAAALALAGCTPDFDPASHVEKLRVLAIQAEPPEVAPPGDPSAAHTAVLTSLVLRPDASVATVLHVACLPRPGDAASTPCVGLAQLRDPTAVLAAAAAEACAAGPGGGLPPITFVGAEVCASGACDPVTLGSTSLRPALAVPGEVGAAFDGLRATRPDHPDLVLGVQAVVLAFALDAAPDELVAGVGTACPLGDVAARLSGLWERRGHVLAMKRVAIRGPLAPDAPNLNPAVAGILSWGAPLPAGSPAVLPPGTYGLAPLTPPGAEALLQPYTRLDAAGRPIEALREEWVYSWFSTAGELDKLNTHGAETDEWVVGPTPGTATVAVVARDLRGGTAWALRRVVVR